MQVPSPLPVRLVALSLALPGVWLAGRSLSRSLDSDRTREALITPALAVSLWIMAIHIIAKAASSFSVGLAAGTLVVSVGGVAASFRRNEVDDDAHPRPGRRIPAVAWIGAATAIVILAPAALRWAIHDETWPTGHMSIPAQMHNNIYPPRDVNFPSFVLHYHYGFDILTAVTMALTRLSSPVALDAITIVCWGYSSILLWAVGERLVGRSKGALTALVTLFGGGVVFLVAGGHAGLTPTSFVKPYTVEDLWVNPPLTSYFFQHPWTLGLPLALAAILVASDRRCRAAPRYLVLGVLLLCLSLTQLVLFLTLSGSFLAQEAFAGGFIRTPGRFRDVLRARFDAGRAIAMTITLVLVLLGARGLGGFFGPGYDGAGPGLIFHPGITTTLRGSALWLALTYGLLLPLGIVGLAFIRRERLFLLALLGGSLAVISLIRHAYTWDIVKFATVAAVALGVLASAALARIAAIRFFPLRVAAFSAALALVLAEGLGFPLVLGLLPKAVPIGQWERAMPELGVYDAEAVGYLRTHISPPQVIYRRKPYAFAYSVWGGLPLAWIGPEAKVLGFSDQRIGPRRRLLDDLPPDAAAYLEQNIVWFVVDPTDMPVSHYVDQWMKDGIAVQRAAFGRLRIVELLRQPPAGAAVSGAR